MTSETTIDNLGLQSSISFSTKSEIASPYNQLYWIVSETCLIIVTLFSIYLVGCLARHAMVTRCKPGREGAGKKGKILYQLCLCAAVMAMGRFASDHSVALVGWKSDPQCLVSVSFSAVFYSLSLYPVYIFLWMRQSIFYANPVLSHVLSPALTFFSWGTLVVMLSGGLVLTVLYVIPEITGWLYVATPSGCEDVAAELGFDVITTTVAVFTVSFQICLLALFMYPLLSKKTQRYRGAGAGKTAPQRNADSSVSDAGDGNEDTPSDVNSQVNGHLNVEPEEKNLTLERAVELKTDYTSSKELIITNHSQNNGNKISANGAISAPNAAIVKPSSVLYRKSPNQTNEAKKRLCQSHRSSTNLGDLIKRGKSPKKAIAASKKSKRSKTQQGRRVMQFIRKAFLLTLTCVVSDIIFAAFQQLVVLPELVYLVLFDVNLLINIVCIVMSFRDWPQMIFPFCTRKRKTSHPRDSTCISGTANSFKHTRSSRLKKLEIANQVNSGTHVNNSYNGGSPA